MPPVLELDGVTAGYGRIEVLHGLTLTVPQGSVVALLGANGAGKTTALGTVAGTIRVRRGQIRLAGERIDGLSAYRISRRGVTLVPEGRGIFRGLSVRANLDAAVRRLDPSVRAARLDGVLDRFRVLRDRLDQRAGTLSGGEQQMLALSRGLLADSRLLLLDEISMGLAPRVVAQLYDTLGELLAEGRSVLLVEQFLTHALRLADICYVMAKGRITFVGEPSELRAGAGAGIFSSR